MAAPAIPAAPTALPLREATGRPAWTRLLISGEEGARKSSTAAKFSADPRCGVMWWLEVGDGENTADEYVKLPGVYYQVVTHDGSFGSIYGALTVLWGEAKRRENAGELPAVITVDSMSSVYTMLVDGAQRIARRKLARQIRDDPKDRRDESAAWDPETEVTITPDLWNRVNSRWGMFMAKLLTWPGPVLMLAREKLATPFVNGKPQERAEKEWTLEGHKGLGFQSTAWVRMTRAGAPEVVKLRSAREEIRSGSEEPNRRRPDFTPAALIFDWIGCEAGVSRAPDHKELRGDDELPGDRAKTPDAGQAAAADAEAARRREHVAQGARAVLDAVDDEHLARLAEQVGSSKVRDDEVADPPLTGDDRDRLGLHESERVTLAELVRRCRDYLARWGVAVRVEDEPPTTVDAAPDEATSALVSGSVVGQPPAPARPVCGRPTRAGGTCEGFYDGGTGFCTGYQQHAGAVPGTPGPAGPVPPYDQPEEEAGEQGDDDICGEPLIDGGTCGEPLGRGETCPYFSEHRVADCGDPTCSGDHP